MEARNTLLPGTLLRHYRVEKVIGQGGFGITYLAYDTELQRNVAIKECYPRDFVSRDGTTVVPSSSENKKDYDWALGKFLDEATTLAKFRHPGIVQVLQILRGENNSAYMVLEYVEGQSLDQWLKTLPGPPSQQQLENIIKPILDALVSVHRESFTHRDIAPDNIFIRTNGEAVLLDFGAAKLTASQFSKTMNLIVKDGYSAPEQYYAEGRQGPWTDIYAFSATLYRCLSGKKPIDAMARLDAINNNEPDPLKPLEDLGLNGFTESFLAAIAVGLSPQAKMRPQNVAAWRQQILGSEVSLQPSPSLPERESVSQTAKQKAVGGKSRKRTAIFATAAAAMIAIGLGGGYWVYGEQLAARQAQAWVEASALDTQQGYENFIATYQESSYVNEARDALTKLRAPWNISIEKGKEGKARAAAPLADGVVVAGDIDEGGGLGKQAAIFNLSRSGKVRWKAELGESGDDIFYSVAPLPEGAVVAAGETAGQSGGKPDGFVVAFAADGKLIWSRRFGGPGNNKLSGLRVLSSGDIVAVGTTMRNINSLALGWLLTLTPKGELVDERTFDAKGGGAFTSVAETGSGGLVLAGNSGQTDESEADFWTVKLSPVDRSVIFDRQSGGQGYDRINGLAPGQNGEFVMVGETTSFANAANLDMSGGKSEPLDGIALRLTADNKMPPKPFFHKGNDALKGVAVARDGTVYAVGQSSAANGGKPAAWILHLSSDLHSVLKEEILDTGHFSEALAVTVLADGSLLIAGSAETTGNTAAFWAKRVTAEMNDGSGN